MPPLRVPADLVARAHADPLGDGPVLGHLLGERPLGAEGLVRRLRGGAAGEGRCRGRVALSGRVCAVSTGFVWRWPVRRSAVGAARRDDRRRFFGVGRSAGPPLRSFAAPARVRDFCATTQQFVCGSRWAPELLARKPRAAPQPLQSKELRPAALADCGVSLQTGLRGDRQRRSDVPQASNA